MVSNTEDACHEAREGLATPVCGGAHKLLELTKLVGGVLAIVDATKLDPHASSIEGRSAVDDEALVGL